MTDPSWSAALRCPSCEGAPLREVGDRLVCDRCEGILLSLEDFASQVPGGDVSVVDDGGATRRCPRCFVPMRGCIVVVGGRHLAQPLLRCARDGIWFGDGALAAAFEAVGTGMSAGGRDDGGFAHLYGGGREHPLPRRLPRLPPRVPGSPVPPSALGDRGLACPSPSCGGRALRYEVSRWLCDGCGGAFVEGAALEALAAEMTNGPWELPPPAGAPGGRRCPACALPLTVEELEGVTVDRCAAHGVWFDPEELPAALQHAAGIAARSDDRIDAAAGLGSWLRRLIS